MNNKINHLAIIMDGNARWAKKNNLSTEEGHKQGAKALSNLLSNIIDLNIPYITFYALSLENLQRPKFEVSNLFKMFNRNIKNSKDMFTKHQIKVKVIGALHKVEKRIQEKINDLVNSTKNNTKVTICFAFSYSSKLEIVDACNKIIELKQSPVTEEDFKNYLYDPEMPDVDLLIRSGATYRISNFLLWQIAYAELYFLDKYWPEITISDILDAVNDFSKRVRNYGIRENLSNNI